MAGFSVDLTELEGADRAVRAALHDGARAVGASPPGTGATGDPDVAAALGTFSSAWSAGLQALTTDVQSSGTSLGLTVLAYSAADERAAMGARRAGVGP